MTLSATTKWNFTDLCGTELDSSKKMPLRIQKQGISAHSSRQLWFFLTVVLPYLWTWVGINSGNQQTCPPWICLTSSRYLGTAIAYSTNTTVTLTMNTRKRALWFAQIHNGVLDPHLLDTTAEILLCKFIGLGRKSLILTWGLQLVFP